MKFSEKLKQAMQQLGINQAQVVGLTGKSKGSISMYLNDKTTPSEQVQSDIAVSLGLNPKPENPIDGAMNPPEKGRRTRRSAAQAQPDNADAAADETPAVDEQPTGRTRRVRKTR